MQVNIHEAKTHFSQIVERALAGEEVVIAKNGHPILTLQPIPSSNRERKPGLSIGKGRIMDGFESPLDDSIIDEFEK
jgi:prevent-host-death family protein